MSESVAVTVKLNAPLAVGVPEMAPEVGPRVSPVGGDNYLMLFVGWEGVGLCSFLLIGYEFCKSGALG